MNDIKQNVISVNVDGKDIKAINMSNGMFSCAMCGGNGKT